MLRWSAANHQHDARAVPSADEDVSGTCRAVYEVPGSKTSLFPICQEQALPRQYEEILLRVLPVIATGGFAWLENGEVDPNLGETTLDFEAATLPEARVLSPKRVLDVDGKPAFLLFDHQFLLGVRCLEDNTTGG